MQLVQEITSVVKNTQNELDSLSDKEHLNRINNSISESKRKEVQAEINQQRAKIKVDAKRQLRGLQIEAEDALAEAYIIKPEHANDDFDLLKTNLDADSLNALYERNDKNPLVMRDAASYASSHELKTNIVYLSHELAIDTLTDYIGGAIRAVETGGLAMAYYLSNKSVSNRVAFIDRLAA